MTKILVIDDDRTIRHLVQKGLTAVGYDVVAAEDGESGLRAFGDVEEVEVLLLDILLPELNGLELFKKIRSIDRKLPIIFITGDSSSGTAIEAMRMGAYDYLAKPLNLEQLRKLVDSAVASRRLMDQPVALSVGNTSDVGEQFIGRSQAMLQVFKAIGRVAAQDVTVLVRGESGCGKELVARALFEHSDRSDKPFVAVNCAALPDQLLESELFGHEKGAFTGAERRRIGRFEQCDGGTIFMDEIGDMSPMVQAKVLRLLQEQKFERVGGNESISTNVRVIAATNRNLEQMVGKGEFREDLLYRLNGFTINLPPLRHRREDIPLMLEYFLRRARQDMRKTDLVGISQEALDILQQYDWPGNVRQLQSLVRQAVLNTTGTVLGPESLPNFIRETAASNRARAERQLAPDQITPAEISLEERENEVEFDPAASSDDRLPLANFIDQQIALGSTNLYAETLQQMEKYLLMRVLQETGGNQSRAAEMLGITRGKVRDRIACYSIQVDQKISLRGHTAEMLEAQ